jgi:hypothetical protein
MPARDPFYDPKVNPLTPAKPKLGYCGVRQRLDGRYESVWDDRVQFVHWDEEQVHRAFLARCGPPVKSAQVRLP